MRFTFIHCRAIDSTMAPLGILYIATLLREKGHSVQTLDPWAHDNHFVDKLAKFKPDLIGLSFLTTQYRRARDILARIRPLLPEARYLAGGIHSTALPEEVLRDLSLDFIVRGEGEETMAEVATGKDLKDIAGISYRKNEEIKQNPPRPPLALLDSLPIPDRTLISYEKYLIPPGPFRGTYCRRAATIISSRGCPFNCIFCGSSKLMFGFKTRRRSVANVIAEIDYLYQRYQIDGLYFLDDTFTLSPAWVEEFCERFKTENYKIKWGGQTRVNTVSFGLLKKMQEAGCCQIDYGVESGSDKVLKILKKGTSVEMIKRAFRLSHLAGLKPTATFMIGNPGEKREDIEETLRVAKEIKPHHVKFFYLTPFPGTELFAMARENKWLAPNLDYSAHWSIRQTELPLMEINFTRHELSRLRASLQNKFIFKNYWHYLANLPFSGRLFMLILSHPREFLHNLKKVLRSKRLDNLLEFSLALYRREKMSSG